MKFFNAETRFDWYLACNSTENVKTVIKTQNTDIVEQNIKNLKFIPNGMYNKILSLVAKDDDEKINILHSYSDYETRKHHMSKHAHDDFIYPVVYTVNYLSTPTFYYSSTNKNGHFGTPKLIWSNGRISSVGNYIDCDGKYALTQFAYAIIDSVENLNKIKKVMDSKIFKNLMELCAVGQLTINYKILSTFRKNFWEDFLDENGNVREL